MKLRFFRQVVAGLVLIANLPVSGGTVAIQRTPVLNATLTAGTYQVEVSSNGTIWLPTGVLVGGSGSPSSVRLDGFSDRLTYRYAQVGSAVLVTPTVTSAVTLSNAFPGATELRIESTPSLTSNAWAFRKFVYPDFTGAFLAATPAPTQAVEFFRTLQPAKPMAIASLSSYTADPNSGYAGFGPVADDMPQLYRDGFIGSTCAQLYHRDGSNAASAGECYELAGPLGTTTVMIGDFTDFPPSGTCGPGQTYFDISTRAYTNIFATGAGSGTAMCRLVPAPLTGNVKLLTVMNAGGFYIELRPYNHRAGVSKLEIRGNGSGTWVDLPRAAYNSFVYNGPAPSFPIEVRVTSRFGETVNFPPLASMTNGQRFSASSQFNVFPEQGPAPVWIIPTVYTDSLNNMYGGQWSATPYGGAIVNPVDAGAAYQGAAGLSVSNFGAFSGVLFYSPSLFSKPLDGALEFAIKTATSAPGTNYTVQFSGVNESGLTANSSTVRLPAISNSWQTIRIPLDPALAPYRIQQFQIVNSSSTPAPPLNLDSMRFRQP